MFDFMNTMQGGGGPQMGGGMQQGMGGMQQGMGDDGPMQMIMRALMQQDGPPGPQEMDETQVGGNQRGMAPADLIMKLMQMRS
jgi:hypothetical protein